MRAASWSNHPENLQRTILIQKNKAAPDASRGCGLSPDAQFEISVTDYRVFVTISMLADG